MSKAVSTSIKYFAYGSNLWSERIRICNPSAVAKSAAKLNGYRLAFGHNGKSWKGFAANIIPDANSHLYGVVWDLQHTDLASLDRQEGVDSGIYERIQVSVQTLQGESIQCLSYQLTEATRKSSISEYGVENQLPSRVYKQVMVCGARENNLPQDYIASLENILDNGYEGEVDVNIPRHLLEK